MRLPWAYGSVSTFVDTTSALSAKADPPKGHPGGTPPSREWIRWKTLNLMRMGFAGQAPFYQVKAV